MLSVTSAVSASITRSSGGPAASSGEVRLILDRGDSLDAIIATGHAASTKSQNDFEVVTPLPIPMVERAPEVDTNPIQIWEGEILAIDEEHATIDARLRSKMGVLPDHDVKISREWVHEQDDDLVRIGAVFYLTLYKSRRRGSLQNAQEIKFRRTPAWSDHQVAKIRATAQELLRKFKSPVVIPDVP